MHYAPRQESCPLPFSPFKSCTIPRPIGWLSTISADGDVARSPVRASSSCGRSLRGDNNNNTDPAHAAGRAGVLHDRAPTWAERCGHA